MAETTKKRQPALAPEGRVVVLPPAAPPDPEVVRKVAAWLAARAKG